MKISVVIPCHNAAPYLAQTLGSLLEQSRPPDEIIVVDDSSTDGSVDVARQFADRIVLRQVRYGLAPRTRNYGAAIASGDALMFLDADDVLGPQALEGLSSTLEGNPDGVSLIAWRRLERRGNVWVERPASIPPPRRSQDLLAAWLTGRYYPPCCILWSREAFMRIGGWSEEFCPNDDGDLVNRAMIEGIVFASSPLGRAYYRRIPDSASLSGLRATPEGLAARLRVLRKIAIWLEERGRLERYGPALTQAGEEILRASRAHALPELERACGAVIERYGLSRTARALRRKQDAVLLRCRKARNRLRRVAWKAVPASNPPAVVQSREVTFGLATAHDFLRRPAEAVVTAITAPPDPVTPTVSVIIPTYNRASLVRRAIASVLAQTFTDFELLVVDDASTDNTAEVIAELRDSRIRYLRQPRNLDVSAARNRGLREARGSYIAFLDSDDEWLPEKLSLQVAHFENLPASFGLVYTAAATVRRDGRQKVSRPHARGDVLHDLLLKNITDKGSGSVMIRRNVIRVAGFFDEKFPAMEDYDYWIRAARFYKFSYLDKPLIRYYDDGRTDKKSLVRAAEILARRRLYAKFAPELRAAGLEQEFLLVSAERRLTRVRPPDRLGAFALSLRALALGPAQVQGYRLAWRATVPARLRGVLRRLRPLAADRPTVTARSDRPNGPARRVPGCGRVVRE